MIRRKIEKRLRAIRKWKEKLTNSKSFQKQKRYSASIKRYINETEKLRAELNQMNEDVDKRIREMGKYSDSEVEQFYSQLEKEARDLEAGESSEKKKVSKSKDIAEIRDARTKLAELKGKGNLQKKIEKAKESLSKDIEEIEGVVGRIIKLNSCLGKVDKGAKLEDEMALEDREQYLYTQELKRIEREKLIYGS